MQIQNVPITSVKPYEKNPRFNDDAVDAVAKSIKEFGWQQPIVTDKDMTVICAPDIVKLIWEGRQPKGLTLDKLRHGIPDSWEEQRKVFGVV